MLPQADKIERRKHADAFAQTGGCQRLAEALRSQDRELVAAALKATLAVATASVGVAVQLIEMGVAAELSDVGARFAKDLEIAAEVRFDPNQNMGDCLSGLWRIWWPQCKQMMHVSACMLLRENPTVPSDV